MGKCWLWIVEPFNRSICSLDLHLTLSLDWTSNSTNGRRFQAQITTNTHPTKSYISRFQCRLFKATCLSSSKSDIFPCLAVNWQDQARDAFREGREGYHAGRDHHQARRRELRGNEKKIPINPLNPQWFNSHPGQLAGAWLSAKAHQEQRDKGWGDSYRSWSWRTSTSQKRGPG